MTLFKDLISLTLMDLVPQYYNLDKRDKSDINPFKNSRRVGP